MRNLAEYPVTPDEIVQCLQRLEPTRNAPGDTQPMLIRAAIEIVRRDCRTSESLRQIVAAMRGSEDAVPPRFIQQIVDATPVNTLLGLPDQNKSD